jgi:hypothetical protein
MIETQGTEKIVTMTCCNSRYATVAETLGHECPAGDGELFGKILKLEEKVANTKWTVRAIESGLISSAYRGGFAADKMAQDGDTLRTRLQNLQGELFSALGALTPAQLRAFGQYRREN